jgi:hypothetical protein
MIPPIAIIETWRGKSVRLSSGTPPVSAPRVPAAPAALTKTPVSTLYLNPAQG